MRTPTPSIENKIADRSRFLAETVQRRDARLLLDLFESLRQLPGIDAHDILDRADATLSPPDRTFLQTALDTFEAAVVDRQNPERIDDRPPRAAAGVWTRVR